MKAVLHEYSRIKLTSQSGFICLFCLSSPLCLSPPYIEIGANGWNGSNLTNVRQCASQIDKTGSGYEEGDGLTVVEGWWWWRGRHGWRGWQEWQTGGIACEGEEMSPLHNKQMTATTNKWCWKAEMSKNLQREKLHRLSALYRDISNLN